MAVFQVLAEVVGAVELLALVAFAKLVDAVEVVDADVPVGGVGEFEAAVGAGVCWRGGGEVSGLRG